MEKLQADLKGVGDLERIASRIAIRKLGPREAMQLKRSLLLLAPMKEQLEKISHPGLKAIAGRLHSCEELLNKLTMALSDDPPALLNKGGTFRKGYHAASDELKELSF